MPFPKQDPRPFTKERIEALNPNQMGVYGLFKQDVWVYVGSGDIRERLLSHHSGDNNCINQQQPTSWVAVVTSDYIEEEKRLTLELTPACNKRVG